MIRIAVIQDSNSEFEIIPLLSRAGMEAQIVSRDVERLAGFHGFVILSFSNISALSPVIKEQSLLGKPVLGIGKGAQILVEAGLVPGLERHQVGMTLAANQQANYYDGRLNMRLSKGYQWNVFTRHLATEKILRVHVAAAEGRFMIPPVLLSEIERNGLHVFQYCNQEGRVVDDFSVNPMGSINNIAAISNKTGNVMAMLPYPECTEANAIFTSMREYIMKGYVANIVTLDYQPRPALRCLLSE